MRVDGAETWSVEAATIPLDSGCSNIVWVLSSAADLHDMPPRLNVNNGFIPRVEVTQRQMAHTSHTAPENRPTHPVAQSARDGGVGLERHPRTDDADIRWVFAGNSPIKKTNGIERWDAVPSLQLPAHFPTLSHRHRRVSHGQSKVGCQTSP
jgi:hypothetical protein